jgi:hypothetical protein
MTWEVLMKIGTMRALATWPALALALAIVIGCGGDSGVKKVTVTGKVTYGGQPVTNGVITFSCMEKDLKGGSDATGIVKNGQFSVSNVTPGKNSATITSGGSTAGESAPMTYDKRGKMPEMTGGKGMDAAKKSVSAEEIPRDANGNSQTFDIKEGMQPLDIQILKK